MATILSLKSVIEIPGSRLTMDTAVGKSITLTLRDGRGSMFDQYKNGLYFIDTTNPAIFFKVNLSYQITHYFKSLQTIKRFY